MVSALQVGMTFACLGEGVKGFCDRGKALSFRLYSLPHACPDVTVGREQPKDMVTNGSAASYALEALSEKLSCKLLLPAISVSVVLGGICGLVGGTAHHHMELSSDWHLCSTNVFVKPRITADQSSSHILPSDFHG